MDCKVLDLGRRARGFGRVVFAAAAAIGIALAPPALAGPPTEAGNGVVVNDDHVADAALDLVYEVMVQEAMGLSEADVFVLRDPVVAGAPMSISVPVEGRSVQVDLVPFTVRTADYQVLVQRGDGSFVRAEPGAVTTVRGTVRDEPGSIVAGAVLEDGLHLVIEIGGARTWMEPISRFLPEAAGRYVMYASSAVLPHDGTCAVPDAAAIGAAARIGGRLADDGATQGGGVCVAELACDADTEYFTDYGSVAAVESRINSVINTVNLQYEAQVGITHQITTIIVRTGSDPYTSTDAQTRLCQFITEWTNNQQAIQRDVAHLFTGANLDGGTIGIASDIGGTGICVNQGACTGGTYGTQGSYCLSESDFNGNFSCATDLTAHELGHLWGAFHCSCTGNTMNPSITCANNFSAGSINSITAYRDTRTCLDGSCSGGPTPPANDLCADAEVVSCNGQTILSNLNGTPVSGVGDSDLPSGSPSCQWQGTPNNVHATVWYEFVAEDTSIEIQTCATTTIQDTIIALYSGACGSLTELACSEDACGSSTYMSSICYSGLTPGQTYRVMVGNPGGWSGSTPGQITLDMACPCPSVGPVAGACCLAGGACNDFTLSGDCAAAGGTFQGAGTNCGGVTCPSGSGACCFANGSCTVDTSAGCSTAGGFYQGDGTSCSPNPCPQPPATGACCFANGSCTVDTSAGCGTAGGTYQGDGTSCSPNPCPQPPATGACCAANESCTIETSAACATAGGTYQGDGTTCSPNPCASSIVNLATADLSTTFGTITGGSFSSTHVQDDVYESIREAQSGGNPARRRSRLQHTWTFQVAAGSSYEFRIDAYHTANSEGDDFAFSYSMDNSNYTPMLTVTKTADNDGVQTYAFPQDVAGTLYVRVVDTDRSQGNSSLDTLFVDEMSVVSSIGGADVTPPAPPAGVSATGGDGQVQVDWSNNGEPDLAGYNVYRSTTDGGPYTKLNGALLAASDYLDTTVTNGAVYYYVATAVDTTGNESANSAQVVATPQGPGGGPVSTHVDSIVVTTVNQGGGNKSGRADVVVRDNEGTPVANATVTGTFSGDLNETVVGVTNASGVVVLITTSTKKGGVSIQFCVDDITHASLVYDAAANVETCDIN